jgi:hypothetical protein
MIRTCAILESIKNNFGKKGGYFNYQTKVLRMKKKPASIIRTCVILEKYQK